MTLVKGNKEEFTQGYLSNVWMSCMDVRVGLLKKAEHQRTDALNCGIGEDS